MSAVEGALSAAGVVGTVTSLDLETRVDTVPLLSAVGGSAPVARIVVGSASTLTIKVELISLTLESGKTVPVTREFLERPTGRAIDMAGEAV